MSYLYLLLLPRHECLVEPSMWMKEDNDTKQIPNWLDLHREGTQDEAANLAAWRDETEVVGIKSYVHLFFQCIY